MEMLLTYVPPVPPVTPTVEGGWEAAVATAQRLQPQVGLRLRAAHIDGSCFVTFARGGEVIDHISPFGRSDAHMVHYINNYERCLEMAASATPNEIIKAFWPVIKGNPRAQMDPTRPAPLFEAFRPRNDRKGCRMRIVDGEVHVRMRHQDLYIGPTHYQVTSDTAYSCTRDRVGAYDRKTDRHRWLADLLAIIYADLVDEGGDFQEL
jgi:hypothetical protein